MQPLPVVSSNIPGATVVESRLDPVATGYAFTEGIPSGETVVVHWYVRDNLGNEATFSSVAIAFVDQMPPFLDLSSVDPMVIVNSIFQVPPPPTITAFDNCDGPVNVVFSQTTPPDTCAAGTFNRTWTAVDQSGNVRTFTQQVVIEADNLPPVILVFPVGGASPCSALSVNYPAWLADQMSRFQATDPSGIRVYSNNAPPVYPPGCARPINVTFRAEDNCGLVVSHTVPFFTEDTVPPEVLLPPKDTVGFCTATGNQLTQLQAWIAARGNISAIDSCTLPEWMSYEMRVNGILRDSAGVLADFLASLDGTCKQASTGGVTYDRVAGNVTVDFTVKDACGNATPAGSATFLLLDTLPPRISGPPIETAECGSGQEATLLRNWINNKAGAVLSDGCSDASWTGFSWTSATGDTGSGNFNAGPYPLVPPNTCSWYVDVSLAAVDNCGNPARDTFRFQLVDTTAPVFTGPVLPDTLYCPPVIPELLPSAWADNCDASVSLSRFVTATDSLCDGSYTLRVRWVATDDCGNTSALLHAIAVLDTTGPVITATPADITLRCDAVILPMPPVLGVNLLATDNCSGVASYTFEDISTQNPDPAVCSHYRYTINRIFTVRDGCGNTGMSVQRIEVDDVEPPIFSGIADTTIACGLPVVPPQPTASDACSGAVDLPLLVAQETLPGACPDAYMLRVQWEAHDRCGNQGLFVQQIHIVDTVAPQWVQVPADLTVSCELVPPVAENVLAIDNCADQVGIQFETVFVRNPDVNSCDHWSNYLIRRQWTASDNCGNTRKYTQTISVKDNTGPEIQIQDTIRLPAEPGLCGASMAIPPPLALYDRCASSEEVVALSGTMPIVSTGPGSPDTSRIDTVRFIWASPVVPPDDAAAGTAVLTIFLDQVDGESDSERLEVWGENQVLLGLTEKTPFQCGSSVTVFNIPPNQLNAWLADGDLVVELSPIGYGAATMNPICPGRQVRAELTFPVARSLLDVDLAYSLDGGFFQPYSGISTAFVDVGNHVISYRATDCAGNTSVMSGVIMVEDLQPPLLSVTPMVTAYVGADGCESLVNLPFPGLMENCGFSDNISRSSAINSVIFEFDMNAQFVPKDMVISIPDMVPNATMGGRLRILHRGDNDHAGEFFRIFSESGAQIGVTSIGPTSGRCADFHETVVFVSAADINAWATDTTVQITLRSNRDAAVYSDFIGPCGPLNPVFQDGISAVQAVMEYRFAAVTYEVLNPQGVVLKTGLLFGQNTQVNLPPGLYTVRYRVLDIHGNAGMADFQLQVWDTLAPTAVCKNFIIQTSPSGAMPGTLTVSDIDGGSTDNCPGNLVLSLSQSSFNCIQAGSVVPVTLTVTDAAGNTASCTASVRVVTTNLTPTYTSNTCQGDTAQIFANPPTGAMYTYLWAGPSGFLSVDQNPKVFNSGTYSVTITGPTGCTATGAVTVDLLGVPAKPVLALQSNALCLGQTVQLQTNALSGATYSWYLGAPPNGILLGTTITPLFVASPPALGQHWYYLVVQVNGCTSPASDLQIVTVNAIPESATLQPDLVICEGQSLQIGTPVVGPGFSYQWTGPNYSYSGPLSTVTVVSNAGPIHSGTYTLLISRNGCTSVPATTAVTVRPKPPKPVVTGTTAVCLGDSIRLSTNLNSPALTWQWIAPTLTDTTTITGLNQLVVSSAALADSGFWRVFVVQQGCSSDVSDGFAVQVVLQPVIQATANTPVCDYLSLQLGVNTVFDNLNYNWTGPAGWNSSLQSPNPPTASGLYTVIGRSKVAACADTSTIQVEVVPRPIIDGISYVGPDCADGTGSASLVPVVVPAGGGYTYVWRGPDGAVFSMQLAPALSNISSQSNGTYSLVATDALGCASLPANAVVNVQDVPVRPMLSALSSSLCEGEALQLQIANNAQYSGVGYSFIWERPGGQGAVTTSVPELILPSVGLADAGLYTVRVQRGACTSAPSASLDIVVFPTPPAPMLTTDSVVCEGAVLQLFTPVIPGATYFWTGPNSFMVPPNVPNPKIDPVGPQDAGSYSVRIQVNGCFSPEGPQVNVVVRPKPKTPFVLPIASACLSSLSDSLFLQMNPGSTTPGATYTWSNPALGSVVAGPDTSTTLILRNLSGFTPGSNAIDVVATLNGCKSSISSRDFQLDVIPPGVQANAGVDRTVCEGTPVVLSAFAPSVGTGIWTQVAGPTASVSDPGQAGSAVTGLSAPNTYAFRWSLSNGACRNYSADTVLIKVNVFERAMAIDFIDTCFADAVVISATPGQQSDGIWTQPSVQIQSGVKITDPDESLTSVTGLMSGQLYYFFWTLQGEGCPPSTDTVTVRNIGSVANAGSDFSVCTRDSCSVLSALALPANESGIWSSQNAQIRFSAPGSPTTGVCGLRPGENRIVWTTNGGICGDKSRDTVLVQYELAPTAQDDNVAVPFGEKISFGVLFNDILPSQYTIQVTQMPQFGLFSDLGNGLFSYQPDLRFSGTDLMVYRVCNPKCPLDACDVANVILRVQEAGDCVIPNVLTPNEDGVNDYFFVPCLIGDQELDNELIIFNQWGDEVFHAAPYLNDWRGTYNGAPLPAGTYFYVIRFNAGGGTQSGFLILQR